MPTPRWTSRTKTFYVPFVRMGEAFIGVTDGHAYGQTKPNNKDEGGDK